MFGAMLASALSSLTGQASGAVNRELRRAWQDHEREQEAQATPAMALPDNTFRMAYLSYEGINFVVMEGDSPERDEDGRQMLLGKLILAASERDSLSFEYASLQYREFGQVKFYGHPPLVEWLVANGGITQWNRTIELF